MAKKTNTGIKSVEKQRMRGAGRKAIENIVESKVSGKEIAKPAPKVEEVKSLVEALKKSVEKAGA